MTALFAEHPCPPERGASVVQPSKLVEASTVVQQRQGDQVVIVTVGRLGEVACFVRPNGIAHARPR